MTAKLIPLLAVLALASMNNFTNADEPIRIGIIGLDTAHAGAFANILNDENAAEDVAGCRVVAAYPKGSPDIQSSASRIPKYTEDFRKRGVEIVDSIDELLTKVDCVLLETNDGRPHLEQLIPCLKAGKRAFIDKPIAGSLADAIAIFQVARRRILICSGMAYMVASRCSPSWERGANRSNAPKKMI